MLVFSKDNTLATFQYHADKLCYIMYSEKEIQEVPYETSKSMKYSRSGFGSKTSAQPIPLTSVKEKCIFFLQFKLSCVLFQNLTEALRKHTASLIHLAGLSQTGYSDSYVRKGIQFNDQSQKTGNQATWLIFQGKK